MIFSAFLLIIIAAGVPVTIPYPYSTMESCKAAIETAGVPYGENNICIPVETTEKMEDGE